MRHVQRRGQRVAGLVVVGTASTTHEEASLPEGVQERTVVVAVQLAEDVVPGVRVENDVVDLRQLRGRDQLETKVFC